MNFCDPSLLSEIYCDKPSVDGYEVQNLLSSSSKQGKGYVAESFTLPPSKISIKFCVPVNISHIEIGSNVHTRTCTGLAVFSDIGKSNSVPPNEKAEDFLTSTREEAQSAGIFSRRIRDIDGQNMGQSSIPNGVDFLLGRFFTAGEQDIVLKNKSYSHWLSFPLPEAKTANSTYFGYLKHPNFNALSNCTKLTLTILKTEPRGPPCLRYLKVWGQPGTQTPAFLRKSVVHRWNKVIASSKKDKVENSESFYGAEVHNNLNKPCESLANCSTINFPIEDMPEDFLDPLTCEVMVVPLLLPSGNSIDASTLERFTQQEAAWGRSPSDPFTGIAFGENNKPEPNLHLKARIDRYILTNKISSIHDGNTVSSSLDRPVLSNGMKPSALLAKGSDFRESQSKTNSSKQKKLYSDSFTSCPTHKRAEKLDTSYSNSVDRSAVTDDDESICLGDNSTISNLTLKNDQSTFKRLNTEEKYTQAKKLKSDHVDNSYNKLDGVRDSKNLSRSLAGKNCKTTAEDLRPKSSDSRSVVRTIGSAIANLSHCRYRTKAAANKSGEIRPLLPSPLQSSKMSEHCKDTCSCGQSNSLYKLLCGHLKCRNCLELSCSDNVILKDLTKSDGVGSSKEERSKTETSELSSRKQIVCDKCSRISERCNIEKVHPSNLFTTLGT